MEERGGIMMLLMMLMVHVSAYLGGIFG